MTEQEILKLIRESFQESFNHNINYCDLVEVPEQLLKYLKCCYNIEYIKRACLDFENNCLHIYIVPPVSLERIKVDWVLADKQNDE